MYVGKRFALSFQLVEKDNCAENYLNVKNLLHNQDFEITKLSTLKTMLHQFSELQSIVVWHLTNN